VVVRPIEGVREHRVITARMNGDAGRDGEALRRGGLSAAAPKSRRIARRRTRSDAPGGPIMREAWDGFRRGRGRGNRRRFARPRRFLTGLIYFFASHRMSMQSVQTGNSHGGSSPGPARGPGRSQGRASGGWRGTEGRTCSPVSLLPTRVRNNRFPGSRADGCGTTARAGGVGENTGNV
jgi:hypothetical protein